MLGVTGSGWGCVSQVGGGAGCHWGGVDITGTCRLCLCGCHRQSVRVCVGITGRGVVCITSKVGRSWRYADMG